MLFQANSFCTLLRETDESLCFTISQQFPALVVLFLVDIKGHPMDIKGAYFHIPISQVCRKANVLFTYGFSFYSPQSSVRVHLVAKEVKLLAS